MDGWLINRSQVRCYLAVLSLRMGPALAPQTQTLEAGMGPDRHLEPNRLAENRMLKNFLLYSIFNQGCLAYH
jgi:hypothetical protein